MAAILVTHEPASRRRHLRSTAPAGIEIDGVRYHVANWGAGGFQLRGYDVAAAPGERLSVKLHLNPGNLAVAFPLTAEVVRRDGGSLAAKFVALSSPQSETLLRCVAAASNGTPVSADGILAASVQPRPFAAARGPREAPPRLPLRRFVISLCYLAVGFTVAWYALRTIASTVALLEIDAAVVSVPLEQVTATAMGTIREMHAAPGTEVLPNQLLFRVTGTAAASAVERARRDLRDAEIDLQEARSRTEQERAKVLAYRGISRDQLEMAEARIRAAAAEHDAAQAELQRVTRLMEYGLASRQLYEIELAKVRRLEALMQQALAEHKIAASSTRTVEAGLFFSGNFLVGDLNTRAAAEHAATERLQAARAALENVLRDDARQDYRTPFSAVVVRVFKSSGATVVPGEPLLVLRRAGEEPFIDAFLTQEEASSMAAGARGTAFVPAQGKSYSVEVAGIDRTAGFVREMQTERFQQPAFTWRGPQERSACAKLRFVGATSSELAKLQPGLPVQVTLSRSRGRLLHLFRPAGAFEVAAAGVSHTPRLWPPHSPLFTAAKSGAFPDTSFAPVQQRLLEAAAKALRTPPAPVETIRSAGVTDQSSPEFLQSRRAFQDADSFAILALAYRLTQKQQYLRHARSILDAWAGVNVPTGHPIDETRLETFLWGIDLLGAEAQSAAVTNWLERWLAAKRRWKFGPKTSTNNHKTHHLKIVLMLGRLLGHNQQFTADLAEAQRHQEANLGFEDGSSRDYRERDAMHYHVYNLEAWNEIALLTGSFGPAVDRAFAFFERTAREHPAHVEFAGTTAPTDRQRAGHGFAYAEPRSYDLKKAARAIFSYATLPGRRVPEWLWRHAREGGTRSSLFYEARYHLWQPRQ